MDEEGNFLTVKCDYDFMGRRVFKKVISGTGTVTSHQRFIYRGYLQIACVDLTRTNHPALWLITWDPTQAIATRPLAIQKDGTWYTYGLDLTKNVCEVFGATGYIRTAYTYSPYGQVTATGNVTQPIQWSSEFNDEELGLVYYNYRYYNTQDGKWLSRDYIRDSNNAYLALKNNSLNVIDLIGLWNDGNNGDVHKNERNRGHSDFYGHERFDYTLADRIYNPLIPAFTYMHFRPIQESEEKIKKAIRICNKNDFEIEMHFMQDFFAHYGQGFRAAPMQTLFWGLELEIQIIYRGDFGHMLHSILDKDSAPDDAWIYRDAFKQADIQSEHWVKQWDKCCGNVKFRLPFVNPCCAIENSIQYGETAAPATKDTLTPYENMMQKYEEEAEYQRHYVLPSFLEKYDFYL